MQSPQMAYLLSSIKGPGFMLKGAFTFALQGKGGQMRRMVVLLVMVVALVALSAPAALALSEGVYCSQGSLNNCTDQVADYSCIGTARTNNVTCQNQSTGKIFKRCVYLGVLANSDFYSCSRKHHHKHHH